VTYVEDGDAHLILAGPESEGVSDDPEGLAVYGDVAESWRRLPDDARQRVHLVSLPMHDADENGAMVNALQRRAQVVVQKSLAEGFGLTVTEAMWKARPLVASRVGGIQDQVIHGETGLLIDDPHDLEAFGRAIEGLLRDPQRAEQFGAAGRKRVTDHFLAVGRLAEYVGLIRSLISPEPGRV
jgi:trehalose synthase